MKKSFLTVCICLLCIAALQAQIANPFSLKPKSPTNYFGISTGLFADTYFELNLDQLETRIKDDNYRRADLSDFNSYDYAVTNAGVSFNLAMRFGDGLNPGFFKESEVGIGIVGGREVLIDYYKGSYESTYQNITFCDMQNELSMYAAKRIGFNFMNMVKLYTGVGANFGTSIGSQFWVFKNTSRIDQNGEYQYEYSDEVYNTKSSLYGRVYAPIGGEIILFKKLSLGAETRIGYGRQQVLGGRSFGGLNYAFNFTAGWNF